jgi:3-methyladenine DNA glycosylase AlkD
VLGRLAASPLLWSAASRCFHVGTHPAGPLENTYWLAERLLEDPEDLMHKATGWMLREAGKMDCRPWVAF